MKTFFSLSSIESPWAGMIMALVFGINKKHWMNALHGQEMNVIKKKRKNYVLLLMIQKERSESKTQERNTINKGRGAYFSCSNKKFLEAWKCHCKRSSNLVFSCLAVRNSTHNNEGKGEEWLESVWECGMRYDVSGWKCYFNLFTRSSSSSKQVIYEGKMFILLYSIAELSIRKLSKLIAFTWYKPSNFEFIKIIKMLSTGLNF